MGVGHVALIPVVRGVDFSGFGPLVSTSTADIWGAAVGNERTVLGWCRDGSCEPPNYGMKTVLSRQTVTITVPGTAASWQVDFFDTTTGTTILSSASLTRQATNITVPLPDFHDAVAFKLHAQ